MMPYMPILALIAGYGMQKMAQHTKKWVKYIAYICLYLVPVFAVIRIYPSRWVTNDHLLPDELYYANTRQVLQKAVPDNILCIVGPDESGAIFLYMLHKKGTVAFQCHDIIAEFEKYKSQMPYLYWYEKECSLPEQVASQVALIQKTGNFSVYKVKF